MMPLNLANVGEETLILKVGGNPETRKHLEDLGFVPGGTATVVSAIGGNLIVKVKESRDASSDEMARKIMIKGRKHDENAARSQDRRNGQGGEAAW